MKKGSSYKKLKPQTFQLTHFAGQCRLSSNNYKTASSKTDGIGDPINYVYTYDADGYPTTATVSQGVLKYEYTKR